MAEIMQGGEIFKLIGSTVQSNNSGKVERFPTYIRIFSYTDANQILIAKAGDAFLEIGSIGHRDPNDRYNIEKMVTHKTYIQVPASQVSKKTKRSETETAALEGISDVFADIFKQYIKNGGAMPPKR